MKMHAAERAGRALRRRGFTLIEVLAALVIVALGMLGVIEAVTQTARNGTYLRDKTLAHWIAMNLITEQRLQSSPPEVTKSSDEVEFAGQRWR
ncbi:General secretion pathway protein I, partial [sediment metagenome]